MTAGGSSAVARFGSAHARICTTTGQVVGAGFLVGPNVVATCAHVIAYATGTDPNAVQPPDSIVAVDFPLLPSAGPRRARVRRWTPIAGDGRGDVAILELDGAVGDSVAPPPFWRAHDPWGREFRMFGFPAELPDGVWASGEFRERQGTGWLQLQRVGGQPITRGFSGAPVWDSGTDAVVGMAAVADPRGYTGTAFMIPIADVLGMDPSFVPNPYRGLEPFDEEHADYFYGRDDDIERVLSALRQRPLVAVAGPSGTGKSSLIRAGVIPRLRAQGRQIASFRLAGDVSPGDAATPVVRAVTPRFDLPDGGELSTLLAEHAARDPGTVDDSVARLLERVPPEGLVLFADQFEDLAATAPERARAVLQWLMELTRADTEGRIRILLTLRWDALNNLIDAELAGFLDGATVALAPMGRDQLRDAIQRPAARAPGVDLQPALVERLVDDTVGEPGALPLLESTLTQLWDRRAGASITVEDYERAGRATGFFTDRADHVLAQFTDPLEAFDVQRLLKLLAAPTSSGGGFVRSVVSMDDFPELRSVAGRLARDRLVVVGRDSHGTDTVELAHQALIDNWSRLRGWLQDDRDFRAWQQQLERDRQKWELSEHDNGALLHGRALEDALDWVDKRKPEVPAAHRLYIGASRRLRRRAVRRLWTVTAVVTVLALVAAGTAVVAYRTSQARTAQLREQAGANLAHQSEVVGDTDADQALQFVEAAGKFAPDNPEVRAAQLLAQVRLGSLESRYSGLWSNAIDTSDSRDGSVLAVAQTNGEIIVVSELFVGEPSRWRLGFVADLIEIELSPDGRKLVAVNSRGGISLWDIPTRSGPMTVRMDAPTGVGRFAVSEMFSDDSRSLIVSFDPKRETGGEMGDPDVIELYDVAGPPRQLSGISADGMAWRLPVRIDPNRAAAWFWEMNSSRQQRSVVRELGTGREIGEWAGGDFSSSGLIVGCGADPAVLTVREMDGTERYHMNVGSCPLGTILDGTKQFAVINTGKYRDAFAIALIVQIDTGRSYYVQIPNDSTSRRATVGITPNGPVVAMKTYDGLERYGVAAELDKSSWQAALPDNNNYASWSPDGRYAQIVRGGVSVLVDLQSRRVVAQAGRKLAELTGAPNTRVAFTPDNRHVLTGTRTNELLVLNNPDLTVERRITLPVPPNLGTAFPASERATHIVVGNNDEATVLYAGVITRWRISDGRQIGNPVQISDNAEDLQNSVRTAFLIGYSNSSSVIVRAGYAELQLWDLDTGVRVRSFSPGALNRIFDVKMNPRDAEVLVKDQAGSVYRWNSITDQSAKVDLAAIPEDFQMAGWSSDGTIVLSGGSEIEVWDTRTQTSTKFAVPGSIRVWTLIGATLIGLSDQGPLYINLDDNNIQQRLCAINNRDYTDAERDKIPRGVDTEPPCASG